MENFLNPIFLFILGSCIGSFLNVYRFRYSKSISIIYPSSYCPKCKKNISWYLNIPIISWIFLRGKCFFCKKNIPISYPFIEFLTGILFFLCSFSNYVFSTNYLVNLIGLVIFTSIIIAISLIDFDHLVIPNDILIFGTGVGLIFNLITSKISNGDKFLTIIYEHLFLSLIFVISFEILNLIITLIIKKEAFGFGDTKYLFMISTWLGVSGGVTTLITSIYVAGFSTIFLILMKQISRKGKMPFGPYLSISAFSIIIFGSDNIISFFKNLYSLS